MNVNIPASLISSVAAASGFLDINLTFSIILSSGSTTKFYASFVKYILAIVRTTHTNEVLPIFVQDSMIICTRYE